MGTRNKYRQARNYLFQRSIRQAWQVVDYELVGLLAPSRGLRVEASLVRLVQNDDRVLGERGVGKALAQQDTVSKIPVKGINERYRVTKFIEENIVCDELNKDDALLLTMSYNETIRVQAFSRIATGVPSPLFQTNLPAQAFDSFGVGCC
jgi:hypothetical protein